MSDIIRSTYLLWIKEIVSVSICFMELIILLVRRTRNDTEREREKGLFN